MSMGPPPAVVQNLPILETATTAYAKVFGQLPLLLRAALLPFLLSAVLALAAQGTENTPLRVILGLLNLLPYTLFGVAWHRLILLGPQAAAPPVMVRWEARHWRFCAYAMILALMNFALLQLLALLAGGATTDPPQETGIGAPLSMTLASLVMFLAIIFVVIRFSFVFPAVAVDENYGLGNSWRHTRGQVARLLLTLLLTLFPLMLGGMTLIGIIVTIMAGGATPGPREAFAADLLFNLLGFLSMGLSVTVMSTAFRICTGWVPAPPGPPAPATTPGPGGGGAPFDREG